MSKEFKDWVSSALSGTASTKSGAIVATDPSFREQARLNFQAVVGGVTWPGLDAASKDAISVTVTLAPQSSTFPAGTGNTLAFANLPPQKQMLASTFRVAIPGVEAKKVTAVSPITVSLVPVPSMQPIVLTLPDAGGGDFRSWFQDTIRSGGNRKTVEISYLEPSLKGAIFTVTLGNAGICGYERLWNTAGVLARVELFAESIASNW